jgi:hypothetical protein
MPWEALAEWGPLDSDLDDLSTPLALGWKGASIVQIFPFYIVCCKLGFERYEGVSL